MTNSLQPDDNKPTNDLTSLTEQNWLFINNFLQNGNIKKSYKLAGYSGKDQSAPYQLFKQLKARIEDLGNLDITSRARLQSDISRLLDIPLQESKKELTLSEYLRVRKFVASITPEVSQQKPQISVLVINRSKDQSNVVDLSKEKGTFGNESPSSLNLKDVIDVTPLNPQSEA